MLKLMPRIELPCYTIWWTTQEIVLQLWPKSLGVLRCSQLIDHSLHGIDYKWQMVAYKRIDQMKTHHFGKFSAHCSQWPVIFERTHWKHHHLMWLGTRRNFWNSSLISEILTAAKQKGVGHRLAVSRIVTKLEMAILTDYEGECGRNVFMNVKVAAKGGILGIKGSEEEWMK